MGVITSSVTTNSGLDILKKLKDMLKTGWTLDEENKILWKDSPAEFPVGIICYTYSSTDYLKPVVKGSDGTLFYVSGNTSSCAAYNPYNTATSTHYISVYTSPNGSIGVGFSTTSRANELNLLIAKNSNIDSTKPQFIIYAFPTNNLLVPGFGYNLSSPVLTTSYTSSAFYAATWSLTNAFDMYTGTALADVYHLAGRQDLNAPPIILANGNNRYIKTCHTSTNAPVMYMRYI